MSAAAVHLPKELRSWHVGESPAGAATGEVVERWGLYEVSSLMSTALLGAWRPGQREPLHEAGAGFRWVIEHLLPRVVAPQAALDGFVESRRAGRRPTDELVNLPLRALGRRKEKVEDHFSYS
jgi:hypothetical protein